MSARRCAIYVRVSTPAQHLAQQLREVRAAVKARGWTVAKIFREKASGVAGSPRPQWDLLRKEAQQRKFGAVAVWSIDRMGRSTLEVLAACEAFAKRGTKLLIVKEGLDTDGPMGQLLLTVLAGVAQLERTIISERTLTGLAGARARGVQLGRRKIEIPDAEMRDHACGKITTAELAKHIGCSSQTIRARARDWVDPDRDFLAEATVARAHAAIVVTRIAKQLKGGGRRRRKRRRISG